MNHWNAIPYRESSLLETFNNITIMAQNASISQCIIEEAKYMYKKVTDIKSSRRTKKEAMKAGCIMLACKLKGVPRNCNEIAQIFKLKIHFI
jgi:transcription initiation factor TFIIIB Brf1 subunit/transcription initiation factor TFIIB